MADKHEILIEIDDAGNVTFEVKGAKGKKCLEITKELEEALGVVTNRESTGEMFQVETQTGTTIEQQGG